jgi:hypothetical protein
MAISEFLLGRAASRCLQLSERPRWKIKSSNTTRVSGDVKYAAVAGGSSEGHVCFGTYVMKSEVLYHHIARLYHQSVSTRIVQNTAHSSLKLF